MQSLITPFMSFSHFLLTQKQGFFSHLIMLEKNMDDVTTSKSFYENQCSHYFMSKPHMFVGEYKQFSWWKNNLYILFMSQDKVL